MKILTYHESENTLVVDELPRICCLGNLSHLHGDLFGKNRNGRPNWLVLCRAGYCIYFHACHHGYSGRPLGACPTIAGLMPFVGRPLHVCHSLLRLCGYGRSGRWCLRCRHFRRFNDISPLQFKRSFLYAHVGIEQLCGLYRVEPSRNGHRERFPTDTRFWHNRIYLHHVVC